MVTGFTGYALAEELTADSKLVLNTGEELIDVLYKDIDTLSLSGSSFNNQTVLEINMVDGTIYEVSSLVINRKTPRR